MTGKAFALEVGSWYALTMFPGYGDARYQSPIRVDDIEQLGEQHVRLDFLNLAYAAGVRNFSLDFEIVRTAPEFLACSPLEQADRIYVFAMLTREWITKCFPRVAAERLFNDAGQPNERTLLALI